MVCRRKTVHRARQILKFIVSHYKFGYDEHAVNVHLKFSLRTGVENGSLKQSKGSGASGSFKLGEKSEKKVARKATNKPKASFKKSKEDEEGFL